MKTWIWLAIILLSGRGLFAQPVQPALDKDPVFREVAARRIHYPAKPASRAIYGRFYAGFTIDQQGHIQDISVLYPKMSRIVSKQYGFDAEIINGLKRMPPLKPEYAGSYVLPIAFCFTHYGEGANPILPTNVLPANYTLNDRLKLAETRIYASSPSDGRQLNYFPHSRQIGQ